VVQELNKGGISVEAIEASFTADLLDGFPAANLSVALADLSKEIAPLNVDRVVGTPEENRIIAAVLSRGADWYQIKITTSSDDEHLIAGIFYQADASLAPPPPPDWARFKTEVATIAPRVSFLAAEVGADCRMVAESGSTAESPIGSAFKLYVLNALVDEVGAGRQHWNDVMTIADAQKSLPSGFLHLRTAGSTLSVQQFATSMIADSDNTATDHLIHRLGRPAIEAMFTTAGHSEPARNMPLMTTREFFLLKLHADDAMRAAYAAKSEADKRQYLERDLAAIDVFSLGEQSRAWKKPIALDTIEWFGSNADLCRAMLRLRDMMAQPEGAPLRAILAKNTVVPFASESWSYAGFKGGSEPGLLNVTWLLQRADGRWFVFGITASDTERNVPQGSVVRQARNAFELIRREL